MATPTEEIVATIEMAKKLGVQSVVIDGITFQLSSVTPASTPTPAAEIEDFKPEEAMAPLDPWHDLTEEEVLFWSCPHGAVLEEEKKLKQNAVKEQQRFEESKKED